MPETIAAKNGSPKKRVVSSGTIERDRVRLPARERARGAVGHVVEVGDRPLDRFERLGAHRRRPVHDARDRRSRDARGRGDLLDRDGAPHRVRAHARCPPLGCYDATVAGVQVECALADDPTVFPPAVLDGALLGVVVDSDDAESLLVAPRPLEVVEQRPVEVAAHVDAGIDRVEDRAEVHAEEVGALVVVHAHLAVLDDALVVVGGAVLGDEERRCRRVPRTPPRRGRAGG